LNNNRNGADDYMSAQPLYRDYAGFLKKKYGEKVYKLPVNLPGTCPNRDGTLGTGGCIFCDEEGSGFECLPNDLSVEKQLRENKGFFTKRFNAKKFIAYFQAFTNTYLPLEDFKRNILAAAAEPDLVGISVSTRPDCLPDSYLEFLRQVGREKDLDMTIEVGLQTVNYHTLAAVNRGHSLAEFIDAVLRIKRYEMSVCAHVILNLPGDAESDAVENAKILSALGADYVKLHSLYIVKKTVLGRMYEKGEVRLITLDEYIDRVILFLRYLAPDIVVQRLVGKGPRGNLYFCNWDTSWWRIKEMIEEKMTEQGFYQGEKYNYLHGQAMR